ncbi:NADPH-dependent 7-cyano-7-deazaguanine reductase QueF [Oceanicoccus sp. KOV_DT_Chl]|uniref:NADPH-dependent 7-cyano-7-deazaguanine reductase QueF n=1 Tax=Oceanicoccus sp. KOV_DT_Chl TaxID=1904639 RepID=UPI000C7E7B94|nr:NADPH-dependent 7-cyano-7-deazaguanine reductase QueF [Oceanicoccus sp. KOV_DT_Chl]
MSDENSEILLGKAVAYVDQYTPALLFAIARKDSRITLGIHDAQLPFHGVDIWNAYELSWLNNKGKPQVACAEFYVPCQSPNIIESKSFKLYLNSFNQTKFTDWSQVQALMVQDLSACAGAAVSVSLLPVSDAGLAPGNVPGECLDALDIEITRYSADPKLLRTSSKHIEEQLSSHLLRSLCPVTGQPDWGSLLIHYSGAKIERAGLLEYIVGYRQHQEFHEQCVERIYCDIMAQCKPRQLSVYARYVRRGGLDINPFRSSIEQNPRNLRLFRQ